MFGISIAGNVDIDKNRYPGKTLVMHDKAL